MIKVSVIIPVYNLESYLDKCLDSVINQTLIDIEIIILNDGSNDNSENIINSYIQRDNRIIYVKHENMGLSLTRNKGITLATGEYLAFVDGDDYLELDMLESLYIKAAESNLDIIVSEAFYEEQTDQKIRMTLPTIKKFNINSTTIKSFFYNYYFTRIYSNSIWDKLYKTKFIKQHKLQFINNKLIFSEDLHFQCQLLVNNPSIGFHSKAYYHYLIREGSLMRGNKPNYLKRQMYLIELIRAMNISNEKLTNQVADCFLFRLLLLETNNRLKKDMSFKIVKNLYEEVTILKGYDTYIKSVRKNKSYKLFFKKQTRWLFYLIIIFQSIKLTKLGYLILYLKIKLLK